jgi:hypothetical protein
MRRPFLLTIALAAGCSGIGLGRSGAAYAPAAIFTEHADIITPLADKPGWGIVTATSDVGWQDMTKGLIGFHLGYMLGTTSASAGELPGSAGTIFPWHMTGTLGLGRFCLMLEYQKRTDAWDFEGGFGGELAAKGYVGYIGYAPVPFLGFAFGAGTLEGELHAGDKSNRAAYGVTAVDGIYAGLNIDAFVVGGGFLQMGWRPRVAIGYTRMTGMEAINVPDRYSGLSVSLEALFTVF